MPEWWTYSLADFLMFSPGVYFRLFELENQRLWPLQCVVPLAGVILTILVLPGSARSLRSVLAVLAGAWSACAWTYFHQSYSTIHTFGNAFAIAFAVQAAALLLQAGTRRTAAISRPIVERIGFLLIIAAIFLEPLLTPALGRPLAQTELFAFMPDPTVLATLGALMAMRKVSIWLLPIPLLWSLYSGLTLYTMGQYAFALMPLSQALMAFAFGILLWRDRRRRA